MNLQGRLGPAAFIVPDPLVLPCVDCGLLTGNFCDGAELRGGPPCLARSDLRSFTVAGQHRELPPGSRPVPPEQRTALCTRCARLSQVHQAEILALAGSVTSLPELCHRCRPTSNRVAIEQPGVFQLLEGVPWVCPPVNGPNTHVAIRSWGYDPATWTAR